MDRNEFYRVRYQVTRPNTPDKTIEIKTYPMMIPSLTIEDEGDIHAAYRRGVGISVLTELYAQEQHVIHAIVNGYRNDRSAK